MGWPGPMTHRQYLVWQCWLDEQWNQPSRSDHYLMQCALETIRAAAGKKGAGLQLSKFKIKFQQSKGPDVRKPLVNPVTGKPIGSIRSMLRARWAKQGMTVVSTPPTVSQE